MTARLPRPRPWRHALLSALAIGLGLAACNQSGRPSVVQVQQTYGAPAAATAVAASGESYTIIPGDTVYGVAERFQVPIRSLIELNNLQPPYRLAAGDQLRLPVQREHVVQAGDNIYDISRQYGVDVSTLAKLNDIPAPYALQPGQRLRLPAPVEAQAVAGATLGGEEAPAPAAAPSSAITVVELPPPPGTSGAASTTTPGAAPAAPVPDASTTTIPPASQPAPSTSTAATTAPAAPQTGAVPLPQPPGATAPTAPPAAEPVTVLPPAVPQPAPLTGGQFLWPVNGKIIAGFGPREGGLHNDGLNIAAPLGTPVRAAENGVVAYAGNELRGFGNMLLIRHADGWMSAYAHADTLLVKRGDNVVRGQTIARVGQTGNVSSPQLHFELRRGADAVDPMKYLGELGAALPPVLSPAGLSPTGGPGVLPGPG
jgi:murein DD-endopeptidase MepM/ murein hydrolase activator NlpD